MTARFGVFTIDSEQRQLIRGHHEFHLTANALTLLALLVAEAPRVIKKDELRERLW
jgi:DNA-binding winged helix-turn-helix (wHTH) protein